jgi:hypothetical protein
VTISWSLVSLVFSGRYSTDINGPVVAGSLRIIASRGTVRSATGELVIRAANGGKYRVSVNIGGFRANGLLTGNGKESGLTSWGETYSLSFTL